MKHVGQDLVTQFTQGNTRAFTAIYNTYYPRLFNFAKRMVDNRQEAQDITAETFVKLWRLHANFSTPDKIRAFLFVTARNACYDYLKYNARENNQQKELIHHLLPETDQVMLRDEIKADVLDHIYTEIEKLPQQCKAVFTLSYLEGRKNNEIAELLQITDKTVRNQKVLAKKLLRVALFDHLRIVSLIICFLPVGW
jgi:RNA polymerase sigma-70 factor (ECF subfamily)